MFLFKLKRDNVFFIVCVFIFFLVVALGSFLHNEKTFSTYLKITQTIHSEQTHFNLVLATFLSSFICCCFCRSAVNIMLHSVYRQSTDACRRERRSLQENNPQNAKEKSN